MVGPARDALRGMLTDMTLCDVRHQARFLERLRQTHPHTVKVLKSRVPLKRYTCGVYAFDLVGNAEYAQIAGFGFGRTFAGAEFLHHLIDQRLLEPRASGAAISGDLAIYFQDDKFVHVGRLLASQRVISKWGTGHLCEHKLWNVPLSYGNEVRFFRGTSRMESLELFIGYAKSKGFRRS